MNTEGPICIIPARGGSRRIPYKNIREFRGWPIIWYSLKTAYESGLFSRFVVSTDDDSIARVAAQFTSVPVELLRRDPAYCADDVGTQDVVRHVLHQIEEREKRELAPDLAVACIYATAPLMTAYDLQTGYCLMVEHNAWAMSVGTEPLCDAGQFYWGQARWFKNGYPLLTTTTRMVPIHPARVCDINTEEDWQRALRMYEALMTRPGDQR